MISINAFYNTEEPQFGHSFHQKNILLSELNPKKWKNAKSVRLEEEKNEKILSNIMNFGGKKAYDNLIKKVHEFDQKNRKNEEVAKKKLNLVCWVHNVDDCPRKKEKNTAEMEEDSDFIMKKEKHYAFLKRKLWI